MVRCTGDHFQQVDIGLEPWKMTVTSFMGIYLQNVKFSYPFVLCFLFELVPNYSKSMKLTFRFQTHRRSTPSHCTIVQWYFNRRSHQTLLGVTGSKTFTVANVVAEVQRPALVLAHNKTLATALF